MIVFQVKIVNNSQILKMIKYILSLSRKNTQYYTRSISYKFAKGDKQQKGSKPQKGGGKKQQSGPPVPVVQQIPPQQIITNYLTPMQNGLSPKQLQILNQGFPDISQAQKKMLDSFADQILDLKTPSFLQFTRWGGLGTSDCFYVATTQLSDQELNNSIALLKKQ